MRSAVLLASLAAALAFAAPDAAAQSAQASAPRMLPASAHVTPLPASLAPAASARTASQPLAGAAGARSAWRYPAIGLLAGAVAGAVAGTYIMATADEYMGAPAHLFTVPAGALLGFAIGGAANLVDRR